MCAWSFALAHALCDHRDANSSDGRRQQLASGHADVRRFGASLPRNHLASLNGTPNVIENSSACDVPICVEHQYVPAGVSVYW